MDTIVGILIANAVLQWIFITALWKYHTQVLAILSTVGDALRRAALGMVELDKRAKDVEQRLDGCYQRDEAN